MQSAFTHRRQCALCRKVPQASFDLKVDKQFQQYLKIKSNQRFDKHFKSLKKEGKLFVDIIIVEFLVGNTYWKIENAPKNRGGTPLDNGWACFIKLKDPNLQHLSHKLIEKVKFELHETYRNPIRWVKAEPDKPIEL